MPRRKSAAQAVAEEAEVTQTEATNTEAETTPEPSRRSIKVAPSEFMALKNELQMSNKDIAAAIGRTLARVSELTHSKGASIEVYERFENDVRAWREANPIQAQPDQG